LAQNSPSAVTYPELGLKIQIFEPFSNLTPEVRALFSDKATPRPRYHDAARGLRLYQGDALELLRRAKSETFDLIFADPPYFLSNGGITCQNGQMVSVNKGDWDKAVTFEQIHAFNLQWMRECHRLLKPNGAIWISGTSHNIYSVGFGLQTLGFKVLNDIAWQKTNPPPHLACRYFTHSHETIIWARKNPKSKHFFDYASMKHDNGNKQMQSVWKLPAPGKWEKRFGKHPTQKPEILLDRILRASSQSGDLVLDPFCGSGTTGAVAARLGRRFVGFDVDESFLDLAQMRLEDEVMPRENSQQTLVFSNEDVIMGGVNGKRRSSPQTCPTSGLLSCGFGPIAWTKDLYRQGGQWCRKTYTQQRLGWSHIRKSSGFTSKYTSRTKRRKLGTQAGLT
jgi:site-specific DNA-methyltransferase (adenine-specific)